MKNDLIHLLQHGWHSLVVANDEIRTFDGRGISDLYALLTEHPGFLLGASVVDKVVGKGAAALLISGCVRELFAGIISTSALGLLQGSGISVSFGEEVPYIINRKGDGICPVERLCKECTTAAECLPFIKEFVTKMKHNF